MAATDVPDDTLEQPASGSLVGAIKPNALVHVTVNVGDGDTQLVLLPADPNGRRRLIIVDAIRASKLEKLIDDLDQAGVLGVGGPLVEIVVATHPHTDHIRGVPRILTRYASSKPELWEPGYRHATGAYLDILGRVARHDLRRTVVSAGMARFIGQTRVAVLAPSVSLQQRFDSYGIDVNNSSVSLKLAYPATQVVRQATAMGVTHSVVDYDIGQSLILGADAQMLSWSHVLADFPQLGPRSTAVTKALRIAGGTAPLRAAIFKVPHHGSKHGLTLELIEAINPKVSIVSSVRGGGSYSFPHEVAMSQIREAVNPRAGKPAVPHDPDHKLILLYTGSTVTPSGTPAGSVCVICEPNGRREMWRLMDGASADIDLNQARMMK